MGIYRAELLASDFRVGCPVVAVAIESREDGDELTGVARLRLRSLDERARRRASSRRASPGGRAAELADVAIAAAEGAIVVSRARRSIEPFDRVRAEIRELLERERRAESREPERKADR